MTKHVNTSHLTQQYVIVQLRIADASGNGGIDYASANEWLDFMNSNQLSFIAWSLSNKAETSALISSGCSAKSGWSDGDLSETGRRWFKSAISGEGSLNMLLISAI